MVSSPGSCGLASATGQAPCAGTSGIGEWNMRVNSPGPAAGGGVLRGSGVGGPACGDGGAWNNRVNSPGPAPGESGGRTGGRAAGTAGSGAGSATGLRNILVNS